MFAQVSLYFLYTSISFLRFSPVSNWRIPMISTPPVGQNLPETKDLKPGNFLLINGRLKAWFPGRNPAVSWMARLANPQFTAVLN